MLTAVYPGSFDPITNGHLDIIERSAKLFDQLVVAVIRNPNKQSRFSMADRQQMLSEAVGHLPNVRVDAFEGLLVNYVHSLQARIVIRGLRAISDFDIEFQMAATNRSLAADIESMFMMTDTRYAFLSSSLVRELAKLGGDISHMVPVPVLKYFAPR